MSFFVDALGDEMIGGGIVKLSATSTVYIDGFGTHTTTTTPFKAAKSCQPLSPDEAHTLGFADYGTNEFIVIYSLKKIPMPSKDGDTVMIHFNNKDWYVRKVLPWVWNEGQPSHTGYYEVILSRFNETNINPD
jgi:hypothetical protein